MRITKATLISRPNDIKPLNTLNTLVKPANMRNGEVRYLLKVVNYYNEYYMKRSKKSISHFPGVSKLAIK